MSKAGDDDNFIRLVQLARDDAALREQLCAILSLDCFNRKSLLHSWLERMRLQNAPAELLSALTLLLDDEVAATALKIITAA